MTKGVKYVIIYTSLTELKFISHEVNEKLFSRRIHHVFVYCKNCSRFFHRHDRRTEHLELPDAVVVWTQRNHFLASLLAVGICVTSVDTSAGLCWNYCRILEQRIVAQDNSCTPSAPIYRSGLTFYILPLSNSSSNSTMSRRRTSRSVPSSFFLYLSVFGKSSAITLL